MFKTLTWNKVVRKLTKFMTPLRGFHPLPGGTPLPSAGARKGNSPFHSVFPFRASRVRAGGSSRVRFAAPVGRALDEIRKNRSGERSRNKAGVCDCFYKFINHFGLGLRFEPLADFSQQANRLGRYKFDRLVLVSPFNNH